MGDTMKRLAIIAGALLFSAGRAFAQLDLWKSNNDREIARLMRESRPNMPGPIEELLPQLPFLFAAFAILVAFVLCYVAYHKRDKIFDAFIATLAWLERRRRAIREWKQDVRRRAEERL